MPLQNKPRWWEFELELSPHVLDRMIDRGFTEADLRLMVEVTDEILPGSGSGRWILCTMLYRERWEVVVEPDESDHVIVVITAYRAEAR